jgi:pimeloyl-ACP methyl ester carboxylesterase
LALPLSLPFIGLGMASAFLPQLPPSDYFKRSATLLLLRPSTFLANARDVAHLAGNLAPQATRYPELATPTLVISGNMDLIVAPQPHAVAFAKAVPHAKLVMLPGMGHMFHHAAADRVVAEIEGLAATIASPTTSP